MNIWTELRKWVRIFPIGQKVKVKPQLDLGWGVGKIIEHKPTSTITMGFTFKVKPKVLTEVDFSSDVFFIDPTTLEKV